MCPVYNVRKALKKTYLKEIVKYRNIAEPEGNPEGRAQGISQRKTTYGRPAEQGRKVVRVTYHSWKLSELKKL